MRNAILSAIAFLAASSAQAQFRDINPAPMYPADWGRVMTPAPAPTMPMTVVLPLTQPQPTTGLREYANKEIQRCMRRHDEQWISCAARLYVEDAEFVQGLFALLSELPAHEAKQWIANFEREAARITSADEPLSPYRDVAAACLQLPAQSEKTTCLDAVMSLVPENLR